MSTYMNSAMFSSYCTPLCLKAADVNGYCVIKRFGQLNVTHITNQLLCNNIDLLSTQRINNALLMI